MGASEVVGDGGILKLDEGNCQIQNHEISNPREKENHPGLRPPLLAVMQGGDSVPPGDGAE